MKKAILLTIILVALGTASLVGATAFRAGYTALRLGQSSAKPIWNASQINRATSSLISMWSFNGQDVEINANAMYDRTGFATGTALSMATTSMYVAGRSGQGIRFDGVDDRINIPDSTALRPASFTLSAWFKADSFATAFAVISKPRTAAPWSSPFTSWLIRVNNSSTIEFGLANAGYSGTTATGLTMVSGQWYHVVMTYDGTTRVGYLNGTQVLSNSFTAPVSYAAQPVLIGADHGASPVGDMTRGVIDEVRIYNRALSTNEVRTLYDMGR